VRQYMGWYCSVVLAVGTTAFFLIYFQSVKNVMQSLSSGITSSSYALYLVLNKVALDVCFRYGRFRLGSRLRHAHDAASQLERGALRLRGVSTVLVIPFRLKHFNSQLED
jgi:hypothetical protein